MAKTFIIIGAGFIILGAGVLLLQKFNIPVGRLPGDILIKKDNFSFYFPITTCIVASAIITLVLYLLRK